MKRIGLNTYIQELAESTTGLYWPNHNISMFNRLFIAGMGHGFLNTSSGGNELLGPFDSPKYLVAQIMVDIEEGGE